VSINTTGPTNGAPPPVKRRRHLMDPDSPRPVRDPQTEDRSLTKVQRWVMSTLAVTTILHLSAGLVLLAMTLPSPTTSAEIGLNVIAGGFGAIAVAAALGIHGRSILSGWLVLGLLPTAIGLLLTFR
jgi:hypothetical protein